MRPSRFTEARIIGVIKEQEAGMPTAEVCRRHGLNPASFYKFKAKYGCMNVSDTHRLKSLEDENANGKGSNERRSKRAACITDNAPHNQTNQMSRTLSWFTQFLVPKTLTTDK